MSKIKAVLTLIVIIAISVFAVQNYHNVPIKFLVYTASISQALIIVISTSIGVIIGLLVGIGTSFKNSKVIKSLNSEQLDIRKKYEDLEKDNNILKANLETANLNIENLEIKLKEAEESLKEAQTNFKIIENN